MASTQTKTEKILFSDGRRGTQTTYYDGEKWVLAEIVVTRKADGTICQYVYGPKRFLQDRVFDFSDLGNVTWETE